MFDFLEERPLSMLIELQIVNFAIIDRLTLTFDEGLTVFTGETGSGKSIIIDAIALLVGGRASAEFVRYGEKKAEIEGLFEIGDAHEVLPVLDSLGIERPDGQIIIRREISAKGKSICRVNGKMVTLTALEKIGQRLIDFHGQHEHQLLMSSEQHLPLLDSFGGEKMDKLLRLYADQYRQTAKLDAECRAFNKNEKEIAQRIDLLQYQIKEIENADLELNEEEALLEEKRKLVNFEKVFQAIKTAYEALEGENRGLDWLRQASTSLESVQDLDSDLKNSAEAMSGSFYALEEQATQLRDHLEEMEYSPARLDAIEARLDQLHLLKKKYGSDIKEILDYAQSIKKEYDDLLHHDDRYETLADDLRRQLEHLRRTAVVISVLRHKTAVRLANAVNRELKDLCMEHAQFDVKLTNAEDLASFKNYRTNGIDKAEFFIATNPGEPMKPLDKIASGGELSRVMLAIKSNFKDVLGVTSIIFDEVDTGVSGRAAQAMAEKIYRLSARSQILCITHLPQVAAMADQHYLIEKKVTAEKRTKTIVKQLDENDKAQEIGRMISGVKMTDLTRQHAKELLQQADKIKLEGSLAH